MKKIKIGNRWIGDGEKAFIIAEAASNHNGKLDQAKRLVDLAKEAGADAVKFQSFVPDKIICKEAFTDKSSFQSKWDKPVYEIYKEFTFPREWHKEIADYCNKIGIIFFSSPYDKEAVDLLEDLATPAYKIGSGDITYLSLVEYIARKNKPILLGTGASNLSDIEQAVKTIKETGNNQIVLLQCITNYPSPIEQANIRVLSTLRSAFQTLVGYSDHTPGCTVALGAVALGACVVEKHFTFDKSFRGPDHPFSMDPEEFTFMVKQIRLLENALGSPIKEIVPAETETVVLQRRSLYAAIDILKGTLIKPDMIEVLRPAKGLLPKEISYVIGRKSIVDIKKGEPITWDKI